MEGFLMNEIILYTTHCPKCNVLEAKLKEKNISYSVCEDVKVMRKKGFLSAPVLSIKNDHSQYLDFMGAIQWLRDYDDSKGDCLGCKLE